MKKPKDLQALFGTAAWAFMMALAAAALLAFAGCGGESDSVPDGGWESTVDGTKMMLLTQNGRMFTIQDDVEQQDDVVELGYSFADGKGTMYHDSVESAAFTLNGNTLTLTSRGKEVVFTKVSKPEKSRFDGFWISKDFMMKLNEAGNGAVIIGYVGPGGTVIIPATIQGIPVTEIGEHAFYDRESFTSVTIPESVTEIGILAFADCTSLTAVTISPVKRDWKNSNAFTRCPKVSPASQGALRAAGYTGGFLNN
jgi:hypothetical protein